MIANRPERKTIVGFAEMNVAAADLHVRPDNQMSSMAERSEQVEWAGSELDDRIPAILDIMLPDLDGFEICRLLRKRGVQIPILFLSARGEERDKIKGLQLGADDYITKPFGVRELIARVENILVRRSIRADGESRRGRRGVMGRLENLGLPDIVQTLTIGMKTACVSLTCDKKTGRIWFENGTPKHAEHAKLTGEEAFYEMIRWKTGEFIIEHRTRTRWNTIEHDSMFLLMEGLRLIDESAIEETKAAS